MNQHYEPYDFLSQGYNVKNKMSFFHTTNKFLLESSGRKSAFLSDQSTFVYDFSHGRTKQKENMNIEYCPPCHTKEILWQQRCQEGNSRVHGKVESLGVC